ncbi:MAG: chemotaxis protein CheW [Cyanobacteria bacterium J06642_11]
MQSQQTAKLDKYIIFQVASYWYVILVSEILKIVNCPSPKDGGMIDLGMVQLGPHTVRLLNLHQIFEITDVEIPAHPFLIVLQSPNHGLWGITLDGTPDLIELTPETLNPVSLTGELTTQSPCISHVGVLAGATGNRTLLRLDVKALIQRHGEPQLASV